MSIPVVTAAQMREMDRVTIEEVGVPGVVLMEVAGRGAAAVVEGLSPGLAGWRVAILCGAGNNGGDGYVVARHLHLRGADVRVFMLAPSERIRGDSLVNLEAAQNLGVDFEWLDSAVGADFDHRLAGYDCVVDALLGTGLSSEVRGRYREVIEAVNASGSLIVAVDIPSGLSSDMGHPLGVAVEADATVTFGHPKIGVVTHPGVEYTGDVHIVDIGIPPALEVQLDVRCHLLEERDVVGLLPSRRLGGHKGTYGHLLVVAGSLGKTGAAVLCARGAARVGAGLVTVAVTADGLPGVAAQSLETMTEAYAPDSAELTSGGREATARLVSMARGKQALAIGPGIPTGEAMVEVLRELLPNATVPVVLDADGLNLAATRPELLKQVSSPLVLTPHPGEMARLLGVTTDEVQADRLTVAREAAARFGAFVALKGARTVLAAPNGQAFINPTGNPGMGSGGMGDVLSGLIGGLLAQGVMAFDALKLAVYLHGLAGDRAAEATGHHALLAGDVLDQVATVLKGWEDRTEG
jgi:ADP-dependent NAD(P)H-hydrate dehydratase / NAD(P)H-hydrate epimerase